MITALGATAWVIAANQGIKDEIIAYFENGDAEGLFSYCSDDVLLIMFEEQEYDSKNAVKESLASFFEQYPPKTFKVRHFGKSEKKNSFYMIGILQTTDQVFRVSIMIDNDKIEDINIDFEKPNG